MLCFLHVTSRLKAIFSFDALKYWIFKYWTFSHCIDWYLLVLYRYRHICLVCGYKFHNCNSPTKNVLCLKSVLVAIPAFLHFPTVMLRSEWTVVAISITMSFIITRSCFFNYCNIIKWNMWVKCTRFFLFIYS